MKNEIFKRSIYDGDKFSIIGKDGIKYRLTINQDYDPINPREDYGGNIGTMICFCRDYSIGDRHNYDNEWDFLYDTAKKYTNIEEEKIYEMNENELIETINQNATDFVYLPLYLLDHSGLSLATYSQDKWDSYCIGYIFVDKKTFFDETCYKDEIDWKEKAKEMLLSEVKLYDRYIRNDLYFFTLEEIINTHTVTTIKRQNGEVKTIERDSIEYEEIDSCGSLYADTLGEILEILSIDIETIEEIK